MQRKKQTQGLEFSASARLRAKILKDSDFFFYSLQITT